MSSHHHHWDSTKQSLLHGQLGMYTACQPVALRFQASVPLQHFCNLLELWLICPCLAVVQSAMQVKQEQGYPSPKSKIAYPCSHACK